MSVEVRPLADCTLCRGWGGCCAFGSSSGDSSHRLAGFSQPGEVTVMREPCGRRAWLPQVVLAAAARTLVGSSGTFLIVL